MSGGWQNGSWSLAPGVDPPTAHCAWLTDSTVSLASGAPVAGRHRFHRIAAIFVVAIHWRAWAWGARIRRCLTSLAEGDQARPELQHTEFGRLTVLLVQQRGRIWWEAGREPNFRHLLAHFVWDDDESSESEA